MAYDPIIQECTPAQVNTPIKDGLVVFRDSITGFLSAKRWDNSIIVFTGGGGGVTGFANALVYINTLGTGASTDSLLTAFPPDQFGRPQIRDVRQLAGLGAVYRQGAWQTDGDSTNQMGEGIIIYGQNANGVLTNAEGGYARIKSNRFGLAQIITGVNANNLFYAFRVDFAIGIVLRNDLNTVTFEANRSRGTILTGKGATAQRPIAVNVGEQWFDISLGANGGKPIWYVGGGLWIDANGTLV